MRYNLKKGAMRLWVVASICWAIFAGVMFIVDAPDWPERPQLLGIEENGEAGIPDHLEEPVLDAAALEKKARQIEVIQTVRERRFREEIKKLGRTSEIPAGTDLSPEERAALIVELEKELNRRRLSRYDEEKSDFIRNILFTLAAVVIVPLLVLLLGHIIAWVVRGFMGDKQA